MTGSAQLTRGHSTQQAGDPARFVLRPNEVAAADRLVSRLLTRFPVDEDDAFLQAVSLHSHDLPRRLRAFLLDLRAHESAPAFVVSGFGVDDGVIGPTPSGWGTQRDPRSTRAQTTWLALCGSVLGDLFGWATQQDGAVVHDIAPVRADEQSQVGSSSAELLWWHTEEAFHPLKCDYLGLMCLRNPDLVGTTLASVAGAGLPAHVRRVLFEKRFMIRPDDSHMTQPSRHDRPEGKAGDLLAAAEQRIKQMNAHPELVALLAGDFDSPYLSIDPFYMDVPAGDRPARNAYEILCATLEARLTEVVLRPGDILFIDNFRAVHGRRPFRARYDGQDRWLKRINITRDLRKSRAYRLASGSRVIY